MNSTSLLSYTKLTLMPSLIGILILTLLGTTVTAQKEPVAQSQPGAQKKLESDGDASSSKSETTKANASTKTDTKSRTDPTANLYTNKIREYTAAREFLFTLQCSVEFQCVGY